MLFEVHVAMDHGAAYAELAGYFRGRDKRLSHQEFLGCCPPQAADGDSVGAIGDGDKRQLEIFSHDGDSVSLYVVVPAIEPLPEVGVFFVFWSPYLEIEGPSVFKRRGQE